MDFSHVPVGADCCLDVVEATIVEAVRRTGARHNLGWVCGIHSLHLDYESKFRLEYGMRVGFADCRLSGRYRADVCLSIRSSYQWIPFWAVEVRLEEIHSNHAFDTRYFSISEYGEMRSV